MRSSRFVPVALLALATACTEDAPNPAESTPPLFAAGAGSPKFQYSHYSVGSNSPFTLSNSFKQTGMGSFTKASYTLAADFTATVQCINGSGKKEPQGQPFQIPGSSATGGDINPSGNGSVVGTLQISLPNPVATPDPCSPHTARITTVFWTNIQFCWGGGSVSATASAQGPIPGGPHSGVVLDAGESDEGIPLTGNGSFASGGTGIFAACTSTEPVP